MARQVKNREKWHQFTMREPKNVLKHFPSELTLTGRGRNAYLWIGASEGAHQVYTFSGAEALRKLAHAILKTVPPK